MLTKSATIILGIIQEHPINAYELIKVLSTFRIKDWYEIADSSVYATLKSLEKKNYIIGETQKSGNMPLEKQNSKKLSKILSYILIMI